MLPSHALAAVIRHALPGLSTAGADAFLSASWQLSMQAAEVLQRGARTHSSSSGVSSSIPPHLNTPSSSGGSPGSRPTHSPSAAQRQLTSQAAGSSTQQPQYSADKAEEPIEA